VLLARSQGKGEAAAPLGVVRRADQASGQLAHQLAAGCDEPDVGAAIAGRQAELLALCECGVCAKPSSIGWTGERCGPCHDRREEGAGPDGAPSALPLTLRGFQGCVFHLAFRRDGKTLVDAGTEQRTIVAGLVRELVDRPGARTVSLRAMDGRVAVSRIPLGLAGGGPRQAAGFPTELQPQLISFLCTAPGVSVVYPRAAIEALWQRNEGIAYVIAPGGIEFADILSDPA